MKADCHDRGGLSRNVAYQGVQARIQVDGKCLTCSFAFSKFGGPAGAESAAAQWLAGINAGLPDKYRTGLRTINASHKASDLPPGVSLCHYKGRGGRLRASYSVCWNDGTRTRAKTFDVGYVDEARAHHYKEARAKAIAFRRDYEAKMASTVEPVSNGV